MTAETLKRGEQKPQSKRSGSSLRREMYKARHIYIMAIPVVAFYILFHYLPMYGAVIAFKDYKPILGFLGSPWVGAKHFIAFFTDPYFWRLIKNTVLLGLYSVIFNTLAAITFALLLNELRGNLFKRTVQTISYLPHFISMVVICGMLTTFLSSDGFITRMLATFGLPKTNLLTVPGYYRTIYIISGVWQTIGWNSIIYLSALTGIDPQLYEAASLDGAGRFKQMLHITLPGIMPTVCVMLIMNVGRVMGLGYEKTILLYNTATYETADIISSYVYRLGLAGTYPQYSYASAVGLFTSIINLLFVVGTNKLSKKLSGAGLW